MANRHDQWREHTRAIGTALVDAAPEGWRRVELFSRATVDSQDHVVTVVRPDGGQTTMDVPPEVPPAVRRIREQFALPGEGTWYAFRYLIDPPGKIQSLYSMDMDPGLDGDPAMWVRDLAAFPRAPEHVPEWLRAKLVAAGADVPEAVRTRSPEELWRLIASRIVFAVPVDWAGVSFQWVAGGSIGPTGRVRRASDRDAFAWELPPDVRDLLTVLRSLTHRPGRGPWRSLDAKVNLDSSADWSYTWDHETDPYPVTVDPADPIESVRRAAADLGIPPERYRTTEVADGACCLIADGDRWAVFGADGDQSTFATLPEAAEDLIHRLYRAHAVFWTTTPADAKRQPGEWPIQPVGGDVGLQMYRGKHLHVLAPGTELDRYGDPSGNTLYANGTEFHRRSEPEAVRDLDFHVYRLLRPARAVSGRARAWYDQPGGGLAHVLEHPVAHYLETGAVEEL